MDWKLSKLRVSTRIALLRILHSVKCANSLLLCKERLNREVARGVVAALPADSEFSCLLQSGNCKVTRKGNFDSRRKKQGTV